MAAVTPDDAAQFPFWRRNAALLAAGNGLQTLGFSTAYPFLPLVVQELGVRRNPESWVGIIVGTLFTLSFMLQPVWGGVADHFGHRILVLRAGLGMGIGYVSVALSPSLGWFMGAMLIVALCNGYTQAVMGLVAANTPARYQGRAQSLTQGGMMIGSTVGPGIGALLAGWLPTVQGLFWVTAAASASGGVLALAWVRERHVRPAQPFRLDIWADLRRCLRVPHLGRLFLLNFLYANRFFGSGTSVALLAQHLLEGGAESWGLNVATWVGIVTLALTLSSAAALPLWGRALDRFDPGTVLSVTLGAALVSSLPFPFVTLPPATGVGADGAGAVCRRGPARAGPPHPGPRAAGHGGPGAGVRQRPVPAWQWHGPGPGRHHRTLVGLAGLLRVQPAAGAGRVASLGAAGGQVAGVEGPFARPARRRSN